MQRQAAQCVGRVIRSKADYGMMIFADKRLVSLHPSAFMSKVAHFFENVRVASSILLLKLSCCFNLFEPLKVC